MPILSPLHDPGTVISTAQGDTPNSNTPETRIQQFELAGRLSRCARMIDDVLFIDVSPEEQQWALKRIYKPDDTGLNTTEECAASPQRVMHLDMEILEDTSAYTPLSTTNATRSRRRARWARCAGFPTWTACSPTRVSMAHTRVQGIPTQGPPSSLRRSRFAALAAQRARASTDDATDADWELRTGTHGL